MFYKMIVFLLIFSCSMETASAAKIATCESKYGDKYPFCCIDFTQAAYKKDCSARDLTCWQFADDVSCEEAAKATHGVLSSGCTLKTPVNGSSILDSYCQKNSANPSGHNLILQK